MYTHQMDPVEPKYTLFLRSEQRQKTYERSKLKAK